MTPLFKRLFARFGGHKHNPLLSARTFEPTAHPLRPILDARYAAMRIAMASGDAEQIAALLAPGYSSLDINRKPKSGPEMIAAVLALDIDRTKRKAVTTLVDIKVVNGCATVLPHYSMTSEHDASPSMPRMLQTLSIDTWRLIGTEWLSERTETLELEVLTAQGAHKYVARIESGTAELRRP